MKVLIGVDPHKVSVAVAAVDEGHENRQGLAADEAKPRSDMARFHEMAPEILYGKTVGSGHFCQLEVPEQVDAMIDRFLAVTLAS